MRNASETGCWVVDMGEEKKLAEREVRQYIVDTQATHAGAARLSLLVESVALPRHS